MWYIYFLTLLIFFKQNADYCITRRTDAPDILLATVICFAEEKTMISEKFHCAPDAEEIRCSHITIDGAKQGEILKNMAFLPSCKINFLKNNEHVSLSIQFDPRILKIHVEKAENKEGNVIIMCYFYDKKIIDMLEICTRKSILQYTFNRSFSFSSLYVKT